MLISFIITYYNEPVTMLRECLDSLLAINILPEEREIIVIDDGSTISFEQEIHSQYSGITYIRQQNKGLSSARNTGLSAATGDYVQFVDADDCLLSSYSSVINTLRKELPDILMFRFHRSATRPIATKAGIDTPISCDPIKGSTYLMTHNLRAAACMYAFRRQLLSDNECADHELRFTEGIYHEDELFTPLLILRADSVIDIDSKVYFYRLHSGTITTSSDTQKAQKRLNDTLYVLKQLRAAGKNLLQRRIHQLTMDYIYNIVCTRSIHELKQRIKQLRESSLYPLPVRFYTTKYLLFSLLTRLFSSK